MEIFLVHLPVSWENNIFFLFEENRSAHHQQIALEQWHVSEKKMDYLGEWHTHPEINPPPSGVDINEWVKITNRLTKPMAFMILGLTRTIWLGLSVNNALIKCSQQPPRRSSYFEAPGD